MGAAQFWHILKPGLALCPLGQMAGADFLNEEKVCQIRGTYPLQMRSAYRMKADVMRGHLKGRLIAISGRS